MITIKVIAQLVSIIAMLMNCLSYQQKEKKRILIFQLWGSALFAVSFFMLGATVGALLNLIGIVRALIFIKKNRFHAQHPIWLFGFGAVYILSYVLTFTVFAKEPTLRNLTVELLPVIAMILTTVSFRYTDARVVRKFGLLNSPLWLIYNIFSLSIGAICSEVINLLSIIIGMIRFDNKNEKSGNQ